MKNFWRVDILNSLSLYISFILSSLFSSLSELRGLVMLRASRLISLFLCLIVQRWLLMYGCIHSATFPSQRLNTSATCLSSVLYVSKFAMQYIFNVVMKFLAVSLLPLNLVGRIPTFSTQDDVDLVVRASAILSDASMFAALICWNISRNIASNLSLLDWAGGAFGVLGALRRSAS